MEIKIISTEIIKPSSPTPDHLRTHKHFLSDNAADIHFPMIFFYSAQRGNATEISSHLKNSLSKTLTYFYPFAGQIKDVISTDCNDHGVIFIETQVVAGEMSEVVQKKDNYLLQPLLPLNGNMQEIPTTYDHANLIVQVNYFGCGGIAISICFHHLIIDGTAASSFVKIWAEVARGRGRGRGRGVNDLKNVVVDYSSINPPYDAYSSLKSLHKQNPYIPTGIVTKAFTFGGRKIAALREKIGNGAYLDRPTRFEAISALISGTLIKNADRETEEFTATQMVVVIPSNLRDKMNPPLPPQCIGNLLTLTFAKLPIDKKIDYNLLAAKFRESTEKLVDQYKRNMHGGGAVEGLANSMVFHISDISRLPFYEADFGWGKPTWVSFIVGVYGATLMPSSDGEGVEAMIALPKEEMAKFEQDPEILACTQLFMPKVSRL